MDVVPFRIIIFISTCTRCMRPCAVSQKYHHLIIRVASSCKRKLATHLWQMSLAQQLVQIYMCSMAKNVLYIRNKFSSRGLVK